MPRPLKIRAHRSSDGGMTINYAVVASEGGVAEIEWWRWLAQL